MSNTVVKNKAVLKIDCRLSESIPLEGVSNKKIDAYQMVCFSKGGNNASGYSGYLNIMTDDNGKLTEVSKNGGIPIRFFPSKNIGEVMSVKYVERGSVKGIENLIEIGKLTTAKSDEGLVFSGSFISCKKGKEIFDKYDDMSKSVSAFTGKEYVTEEDLKLYSGEYLAFSRDRVEAYEKSGNGVDVSVIYGKELVFPDEFIEKINGSDKKPVSETGSKESFKNKFKSRPLARNYNDKYGEYYLDSLIWIKKNSETFEDECKKFIKSAIEFRLDFLMKGVKDVDKVVSASSKEIKDLISADTFKDQFDFIDIKDLRKIFSQKINEYKVEENSPAI